MCSAVALTVLPASAAPGQSLIDAGVRRGLDSGAPTQHVIITLANPACRTAWRTALQQHGDVISGDHPFINAISGEIHSADVAALAADGCVKAVSADATLYADAASGSKAQKGQKGPHSGSLIDVSQTQTSQPSQTPADPLRDTLGLPHFASTDPSVPTGSGVTVALIDSGIAPSADFSGRISSFWDFTVAGKLKSSMPYDDFGHGTHVAGLIGASGVLSNFEYTGVAPSVNFVALKVLDAAGQGKTSDVIRAIDFVIANKSALGVQVINLSLGHPILSPAADDPLVQAVEQATAAGIVVVASAGNFGEKQSDGSVGYMGITSPGNAPDAITVGSVMTQGTTTRADDVVAPYSSRGPTWFDAFAKPDVVAPGHQLASDTNLSSYLYTLLTNNQVNASNGARLLQLSGSSMATAVTAGVVALILEAHADNGFNHQVPFTANLVKGILEYSAIAIPDTDCLTQGAGEINAAGAIDLARKIDTSKNLGMTWFKNVTPVSVIGGASYSWSQHVIYGGTVYGSPSLTANNIVWSSNIVWGTNIVWGSNIVWSALTAQNIVWATMVSDGDSDNIVWGGVSSSA